MNIIDFWLKISQLYSKSGQWEASERLVRPINAECASRSSNRKQLNRPITIDLRSQWIFPAPRAPARDQRIRMPPPISSIGASRRRRTTAPALRRHRQARWDSIFNVLLTIFDEIVKIYFLKIPAANIRRGYYNAGGARYWRTSPCR